MGFQKATKHQAKLRLALIGPSGSGKTFSALNIGQHLGARVAVIDTEHGSASKYAHRWGFDVLELESYHPKKYVEAIHEAETAGYDVLIIDSLSHAWAGKDGVLEQVDRVAARSGNKYTAWGDVTPFQNALVDAIIGARLHVIATIRSKMEHVQEKDEKTGRTVVRKIGLQPVQRDQIEYEFDVIGDLTMEHELVIGKTRCELLDGESFNDPGKDVADVLKAWLAEGEPVAVTEHHAPPPAAPAPTTPADDPAPSSAQVAAFAGFEANMAADDHCWGCGVIIADHHDGSRLWPEVKIRTASLQKHKHACCFDCGRDATPVVEARRLARLARGQGVMA